MRVGKKTPDRQSEAIARITPLPSFLHQTERPRVNRVCHAPFPEAKPQCLLQIHQRQLCVVQALILSFSSPHTNTMRSKVAGLDFVVAVGVCFGGVRDGTQVLVHARPELHH